MELGKLAKQHEETQKRNMGGKEEVHTGNVGKAVGKRSTRGRNLQYRHVGVKVDGKLHTVLQNSVITKPAEFKPLCEESHR